jgi:ABC-type transport system involved in multi-copper enzyme maturation permease subunit
LEALRWVGILFGVMLVAGALGSEYTWGTLRPFLTCVESRTKYLGAKLIALGVLTLLGLVAAMIAAVAASLVIAGVKGGLELDFLDGAYLRDGFYDFGRTAFAITPYLLIAALAAVVGRSALPAAVTGLGVLVVESIASPLMLRADNWVRHIPDFLLNRNVDAVMGEKGIVMSTTVTGNQVIELILKPPDPWQAALVLSVYGLAALLLVWYVFHRRDVTA